MKKSGKKNKLQDRKRMLGLLLAVLLVLTSAAAPFAQETAGTAEESRTELAAGGQEENKETLKPEEGREETAGDETGTDLQASDETETEPKNAEEAEAPDESAAEETPAEETAAEEREEEAPGAYPSETAPEVAGGIFAGETAMEETVPAGEDDPDNQNPDNQNPDNQNPDNQNPDNQNPDNQNPDNQNPDNQNLPDDPVNNGETGNTGETGNNNTDPDTGNTNTGAADNDGKTDGSTDGNTDGNADTGSGETTAGDKQTAEDEEITLSVRIVWPAEKNPDQPVPAQLDAALYLKTRYEATMAANGFTGDMLNYYPYSMKGYVAKVTVTPASSWQGSVTVKRSELTGIAADQSLVDYVKANLVWKEERPMGYAYAGSTVSEDAVLTTISNRAETAVTSRTIRIVWDDSENAEGMRPASVAGVLNSGQSVVLSPANNWTAQIGSLPFYVNGTRYDYEWNDPEATNYAVSEVNIEETETVFTLKCLVKTETEQSEIEQKYYKLTIRYYRGSTKLFDDYVGLYAAGDTYNVKSPKKAGYIPSKSRVKGTIKKNTKVTVKYTPQEYRLTIRYIGTDGRVISESYTDDVKTGETYKVSSPRVNGYTAQSEVVSGKMPGKDTEIVVYYSPVETEAQTSRSGSQTAARQTQTSAAAAQPQTQRTTETEASTETELQDYETPLGLGTVSVNAGDCLE